MSCSGIIILFNPTKDQINHINKVSVFFTEMFVFDNSTNKKNIADKLNKKITYFTAKRNIGLSKALNKGIDFFLKKNDIETICFFDQDSKIEIKDIEKLNSILLNSNYTAIGPKIINERENNEVLDPVIENRIRSKSMIITSGMIVKKKSFNEIGLMDENLFIDYIDHEWCARAISFNHRIGICDSIKMNHNIGNRDVIFFKRKMFFHDSAERQFHYLRNGLIFINRKYVPKTKKIRHFYKLIKKTIAFVYFSKKRRKTISKVFEAYSDFIVNRKNYLYPKY